MAAVTGNSSANNQAAVTGTNNGPSGGNGIGVFGTSTNGEGVHGETNSTTFAAVAGIELNSSSNIAAVYGEQRGSGPGVFGTSVNGEGVHGQTTSAKAAAVAGFSTGGYEGVHGETTATNGSAAVGAINRGNGPGFWGISQQAEGVRGQTTSAKAAAVAGFSTGGYEGVHGETTATNGSAAVGAINRGNGPAFYGISQVGEGVHGETNSTTFAAVAGIELNAGSNVAAVYGEQRGNGPGVSGIAKGSGAGVYGQSAQGPAGFFQGSVVVTGDVQLSGADCAEQFDVAGAEQLAPGTVVVIDQQGALGESCEAYDKRVAGVVSGAGECKPGVILGARTSQRGRVPVALVGTAYCKVDAQYSPIAVGDLLTSSPTPGHAMRANDPLQAFGSVIGKALQPKKEGRGLIPVLVALQ